MVWQKHHNEKLKRFESKNIKIILCGSECFVMKKAIFLDRDGTLIEDKGYEHIIDSLKVYKSQINSNVQKVQKRKSSYNCLSNDGK